MKIYRPSLFFAIALTIILILDKGFYANVVFLISMGFICVLDHLFYIRKSLEE